MEHQHYSYQVKRTALFSLICLMTMCILVTYHFSVYADEGNPSWTEIEKRLIKHSSELHSIKAYLRVDTYTTQSFREKTKREWEKDLREGIYPRLKDSNKSEGFFWITDGNRWRCDKVLYYPEAADTLSQDAYDGERYYIYDPYRNKGFISASNDKADPFMFTNLSSVELLGLYTPPNSEIEKVVTSKYQFAGSEKVGGFDCLKFITTEKEYKSSIWICPSEDYALIKHREGRRDKNGEGAETVIQVIELTTINGVKIAKKSIQTLYEIHKDKEEPVLSRVLNMEKSDINLKVNNGYFQDIFRIGTRVVDEIENPGIVTIVGGNPAKGVQEVQAGGFPSLPY